MTKARDIADSDLEDLVVQNDIEVSGGIFLGGTGSANNLDDYETGTWTPSISATGSFSTSDSEYTKVGNTVYLKTQVNFSSASGGMSLTNLPYLPKGRDVGIGREDQQNGYCVYFRIRSDFNNASLYYAGEIGNASPFQVSSGRLVLSITYTTDD